MWPLLTYLFLLLAIIFGQVIRIPIAPDSDLSLRISDLAVFIVTLSYLAVVGWNFLRHRQKPMVSLTKVDKLFLGFEFVLLLTFLLNLNSFDNDAILTGFGYQLRLQAYLILYWVFRSFKSIVSPLDYLRYFFLATIIVAILGIIQLIFFGDFRFMADFGWDPHLGRLLSTFYDPNFVAAFLGIGIIIGLGQVLFSEPKSVKYYLALLLLFITLYLTFSRSGIISTAIPAVLLGMRKDWKSGTVIFLIFLLMMLSPGRLGGRFTDLFSRTNLQANQSGQTTLVSTDDTGSQRLISWYRGLSVIKSSPIIGVGYNNFGPASVELGVRDEKEVSTGAAQSSDSSLLNIWATTGIVGLGLFIALIWQILGLALRQSRSNLFDGNNLWRYSIGISFLLIGLDSIFINSLLYPQILIFWLIFSALLVNTTSQTNQADD